MMEKIEDLTYMHANFNFVDFKSGQPLGRPQVHCVQFGGKLRGQFRGNLWNNHCDNLYCYQAVK